MLQEKARAFTGYVMLLSMANHCTRTTIPVTIAGYVAFKFYPNPVDHVLIVRTEAPLDLMITDANGRLRLSESHVQGLHTINVSSLEKGVYLIRFINKLTNIMSQEKLIKN
jgi:hypothetical protein